MPQKSEQNLEKGKMQENDNALAGGDVREENITPLNQEKINEKKEKEGR